MITPRFHLTQTDTTVTITIRAPNCSLNELDTSVEDDIFIFSCRPYYLRLHLPGKLLDDDTAHSKFDNGEFTFTHTKTTEGETFEGLDLITTLLCPTVEVEEGGRKIEILSSSSPAEDVVESELQYGFAQRGGYSLNTTMVMEFPELFQLDPTVVKLADRATQRTQKELQDFDPDHYIWDLKEETDEIDEIKTLNTPWNKFKSDDVTFNEKELDFLKDLKNVQFDLSDKQVRYALNSLVDILFAYCYDRRTTSYEGTCESGWTINKLSASLCYFDGFESVQDAVISAYRRCLIYPLHRHFDLCCTVLDDVKSLLSLGQKFIVKCLIEIYNIFLYGEAGRYVLNNLFIKDYIVYVMKWDKDVWEGFLRDVLLLEVHKRDLGLELEELENDADDLCDKMNELKIDGLSTYQGIKESCHDSDDDSSTCSYESDSSDHSFYDTDD